jgi:DNA-binding transcriptional MocR family regulator
VLALGAERTAEGEVVARVNGRELAAALGIGRDAATKALGTLRRRGLISIAQRRAPGGRFVGTRYLIELPVEDDSDQPRGPRRAAHHGPAPTLFDSPNDHRGADHDHHPDNLDEAEGNDQPDYYSDYYSDYYTNLTAPARDLTEDQHALAFKMRGGVDASEASC